MRKNFVVLILMISVFSIKAQKINVYDTLLTHHLFAHLDQEKKADYFLDKNKNLKRKVSLFSEEVHYHKSHEDSLYLFLKGALKENFGTLIFFAAENVKWETGKDSSFAWKKGKQLKKEQLDKVFSSLTEMPNQPKRGEFLQGEENAHFFFYHNYLRDSASRTIFCFSRAEGKYNGKIVYGADNRINYEAGFYPDRKIFYEVKSGVLSIYSKTGAKLFSNDGSSVRGFSETGEELWKYDLATQKMSGKKQDITTFKIHEYYAQIYAMWKEAMGD